MLRVTGYGLHVTGYGLRVTGYGVRVTGYGVRVADCWLRQVFAGILNLPMIDVRDNLTVSVLIWC